MFKLPAIELIGAVREIAAENPDKVYAKFGVTPLGFDNCLYVHPKEEGYEPGCLLGHAFLKLGVDVESILPVNDSGIDDIINDLDESHNYYDARWLDKVQEYQDTGASWGEAVRKADLFVTFDNEEDY